MRVVSFDIETGSVEELHSFGPGYVRLCGWTDATDPAAPVHINADPARLVDALNQADAITGHNILNFDLLALAKYHGADYERLARKSFDTIVDGCAARRKPTGLSRARKTSSACSSCWPPCTADST